MNMALKARPTSLDSPKAEVGEIDTRAPFASVKAAVSLFGEVAFSSDKSTPRKPKPSTPEQKAFATETQLHLAQKELNKFKEKLYNAESTRIQALQELEKVKRTVDDLTVRLVIISESKELALKATEAATNQTNQLKEVNPSGDQTGMLELERSREQYAGAITELDSAKHELRRIRKDFEAAVEAKIAAFSQEAEAKQQSAVNTDKADQLSKEIAAVQESLNHVKLATEQAKEEESKIRSEKDSMRQSYQLALEETEQKLASLKKDLNPELHKELELKLAEANAEIDAVRKELEDVRAADLEAVTTVTTELEGAKEVLRKLEEEESSLRSLIESLKLELEAVMKEHNNLKQKDAETETLIGHLHFNIQKCKTELETAMASESKASSASAELMSTLQQLTVESESALQEAEAMKKEAEAMRKAAESARGTLLETEKKLEAALKEAEAATAAETQALDEIKNHSRTAAPLSSTSIEAGATEVTISKEEYESLRQKVDESEKLTAMKVAAAVAQVDAVRASEAEAEKRLELAQKEIEEMEAATEEAVKRADMAEAAKKAVEGELKRWREKELKRTADLAAQIIAESEAQATATQAAAVQAIVTDPPPNADKSTAAVVAAVDNGEGNKKVTRGAGSLRRALLPNFSGIFQRRKSQVDGGSPAYEKSD